MDETWLSGLQVTLPPSAAHEQAALGVEETRQPAADDTAAPAPPEAAGRRAVPQPRQEKKTAGSTARVSKAAQTKPFANAGSGAKAKTTARKTTKRPRTSPGNPRCTGSSWAC